MIDSVKKAFVLSVKALKLFYVLAAVAVVTNVISVLMIPAPVNEEMTVGRSFAVIAFALVSVLVSIFIYSGALAYIKELIKTGSGKLESFVADGKKYFLKILAVVAIISLVFLLIGLVLLGILGILPAAVKPLFTVIIVLVSIALAVLSVMPSYVVVGSDLGAVESIKKGVLFGKNNFLKVLGILGIIFLVGIAVMIAASLLSGILSLVLRPLAVYVSAIIMAIANVVLMLLANIAYMDFYLKS